jgi:hypothetical protein
VDIEKILFITIAIGLSIFSMYRKAKKQSKSSNGNEEVYQDFQEENNYHELTEPMVIFEHIDAEKSQQNFNIPTKKIKKPISSQNIENANIMVENPKTVLQNTDLEIENELLEGFEGTEIQKAFLYSEIFKSAKN